jgi:hypothetical protein
MSYNYSQMHDIISKQYAKKEGTGENWFLEESIKFGKGYSKPSEYLETIAKKVINSSDKNKNDNIIDDALYIDKN